MKFKDRVKRYLPEEAKKPIAYDIAGGSHIMSSKVYEIAQKKPDEFESELHESEPMYSKEEVRNKFAPNKKGAWYCDYAKEELGKDIRIA